MLLLRTLRRTVLLTRWVFTFNSIPDCLSAGQLGPSGTYLVAWEANDHNVGCQIEPAIRLCPPHSIALPLQCSRPCERFPGPGYQGNNRYPESHQGQRANGETCRGHLFLRIDRQWKEA